MNEEVLKQLIILSVVFVSVTLAMLLVRRIVLGALSRWSEKTKTTVDDAITNALRAPSIWWALAIGLYMALATSELSAKYVEYGLKAIYVIIIISVTMAAASITSRIFQKKIESSVKGTDKAIPATGLSKAIVNALIFTIGFLVILNSLGISITPLLTALGVGGLAVALALQDTLSNLFSGVHILLERPLKVGDYVKLDSGEEGYVVDIGWRTTRIRKIGNNLIIIPNSKLSQSTITNYCMPEKRMSLLIPVGVSYDTDPERLEEILLDVAKSAVGEIKGLRRDPAPLVRFSPGFGESSLDFTLICQIEEFVDQYYVQHELRKRIFKRLNEEKIEIPFPIRTVYMKQS
jgi:small-conductance mechanosensitive channel